MINLKLIIKEFYNIFNRKQTFFEIILNLSFILILAIITTIFYWDSINRSIIRTSRCKVMINSDDNSFFKLDVLTKEHRDKLYSITYDNSKNHNAKIDCTCKSGTTANNFNVIYYDYKDDKIVRDYYKSCMCDQDYTNSTNFNQDFLNKQLDGDAFLEDYYRKIQDNPSSSSLSYRLEFPD
jgi:hypothetical protein